MASDGDTVFRHADAAFDAAIDVKRFRTCDFAFNNDRLANGSLLQWATAHAKRSIGNGSRGTLRLLGFRRLQHLASAFRSAADGPLC